MKSWWKLCVLLFAWLAGISFTHAVPVIPSPAGNILYRSSLAPAAPPLTSAVTKTDLYEAYGNITSSTGTSDNNRLANTKERSFALGLDNHGFRYYDPEVGRYLTRDPIGYGDGLNVYLYVHNNPINHIDPLGLFVGFLSSWIAERADAYSNDSNNPAVLTAAASLLATGQRMTAGMDPIYSGYQSRRSDIEAVREHGFTGGVQARFGEYYDGIKESVGTSDFVRMADYGDEYSTGEQVWYGVQGTAKTFLTVVSAAGIGKTISGSVKGTAPNSSRRAVAEAESKSRALESGGMCFPAGTLVSTPSGMVSIETLRIGDVVYAYDFDRCETVTRNILDTYSNYTYYWVDIAVANEVITATRFHRFWVESEQNWIEAIDLEPGMTVRLMDGQIEVVQAATLRELEEPELTYNLEVETDHNYFVSQNGVLVHNGSPNFIVDAGGTAFPVQPGAQGPFPVLNKAGKQTGVAFTGGSGGQNGQVMAMRIMDATPPRGASPGYPNGYVIYENGVGPGAQPVDPYTGKTVSNTEAHHPIRKAHAAGGKPGC